MNVEERRGERRDRRDRNERGGDRRQGGFRGDRNNNGGERRQGGFRRENNGPRFSAGPRGPQGRPFTRNNAAEAPKKEGGAQ